jgi:hypothetical protein
VAIDLGRFRVRVTHPLLDGAQRNPGRRELGAKGVAELVEGDLLQARPREGLLEALARLRRVEGLSGLRVAEHEISAPHSRPRQVDSVSASEGDALVRPHAGRGRGSDAGWSGCAATLLESARGLDDDATGALGEDGLEGPAE